MRADRALLSNLGLFIALLLVAGWIIWAIRAHITRYEVSESARLEVNGAPYPVQSSVAGRLVSSQLALNKQVQAGDVLLELDSKGERLALEQEEAHLRALAPQLAALRSEMQLENTGGGDDRRVQTASVAAAKAQYAEAETRARLADQEAARAARLRAEGIIAEADAQRAQAEAQSRRAVVENLKQAISRLTPELDVRERDRELRAQQILADTAKLEAEIVTAAASVKRLEYEIERRRIRAPISGRLSECAMLHPGAHISEGQQLGVVLASGEVEVVGEFLPAAAFGKIRPGQPATLRLQGFPWAEYGTISGTVSRVAGEVREGKVRVEVSIDRSSRSPIPVQHGLPGSLEVEVERLTPAALILRSAGEIVGAH